MIRELQDTMHDDANYTNIFFYCVWIKYFQSINQLKGSSFVQNLKYVNNIEQDSKWVVLCWLFTCFVN